MILKRLKNPPFASVDALQSQAHEPHCVRCAAAFAGIPLLYHKTLKHSMLPRVPEATR
jgi:hypothetical protein